MRAWSCMVVRGRAWSCVVVPSRAWSCVVVRGSAWSCMVMRGRAPSRPTEHYVLPASRPITAHRLVYTAARTNERTTSNNPLNPPGVGWVNFCYPIKVRVSMGICVPNLSVIRRPVRKSVLQVYNRIGSQLYPYLERLLCHLFVWV